MEAALQSFVSYRNPNLNPDIHRNRVASALLSRLSASSSFQFKARRTKHFTVVPGLPCSEQSSSIRRRCLENRLLAIDRRFPKHVTFAAPLDSKHSEIDVERGKTEHGVENNESQKVWKQVLESFKEEAVKMQGVSQEAYEIYSKRAIILLKETSEKLKIQADQARHDLSEITKEISEEGKIYLSTAAKNSPESMKDIVETFASLPDELKDIFEVRDFYLGIPYGGFLAIGGFLDFMLTGSISAIRFGVILGSALLALSISSLRAWKSGESSALFLRGQAAIAAIVFLREWRLLFQRLSVPTFFMTLISGAMLAFYVFRIIGNHQNKGPSLGQQGPEN